MNLDYIYKSDKELVELSSHKETTRDANKEIKRRKDVGSWRLIANWNPDKEVVEEERVYAPGVRKMA